MATTIHGIATAFNDLLNLGNLLLMKVQGPRWRGGLLTRLCCTGRRPGY